MVKPTADPSLYRPAVGIAIFNEAGKVWLGHRRGGKGPYVWQMPQGGMDRGESPEFSAMREMEEETGIRLFQVKPLGHITRELFYDFPDKYIKKNARKWRGQRQTWLAVRFTGRDSEIDLKVQSPPEFSKWRWEELSKTPDLIVPFKRKVYETIVQEFKKYTQQTK